MNEPKLRFKADDGSQFPDWEEHNFGDLYKVCSGYAFKYENYCDSGVALINGQSIQHGWIDDNNMNYLPEAFLQQYEDFALKENDIVLGLNRPITNGKLKIARVPKEYNNSLLYQRAGKIVCKKAVDDNFSYALLAREIFKFTIKEAAGSDQPFISTSKLNNWKIIVPSSEQEQQKIAEFLSTVDTVIAKQRETVSAWEERKKGVMQKLFSQEVRFKADDGSEFPEWEIHPLSYYVYENKDRNKKKYYEKKDVLSVSKDAGVVNQIEYMGKSLAGNDLSNYHVVYNGNIIYTKSPLGQQPYGIIKASKMEGVCSTLYAVYHCSEKVIPEFVDYYFSRDEVLNRYLKPLVNIGAKHDMKVHNDVAISGNVKFPCIDEQEKILDCLSSLDEVIEKQKATLAAWEALKKGLLQQMFV